MTVDALAEGLEYFLSDPDRLQHASIRARASARDYSRERFAAAWAEEFGVSDASGEPAGLKTRGYRYL